MRISENLQAEECDETRLPKFQAEIEAAEVVFWMIHSPLNLTNPFLEIPFQLPLPHSSVCKVFAALIPGFLVFLFCLRGNIVCVCAYPSFLWISWAILSWCVFPIELGNVFVAKGLLEDAARLHTCTKGMGRTEVGERKTLSIAMNLPKPSQEFSDNIGPSIHKTKGFSRNSPQKAHPNFAQNLGRQILGNAFSGLIEEGIDVKNACLCSGKQQHGMSARRSVLLEERSENAPRMLLKPLQEWDFWPLCRPKARIGMGGGSKCTEARSCFVANVCRWWLRQFFSGKGSACHETHHYQDTIGDYQDIVGAQGCCSDVLRTLIRKTRFKKGLESTST